MSKRRQSDIDSWPANGGIRWAASPIRVIGKGRLSFQGVFKGNFLVGKLRNDDVARNKSRCR
jgi:hypothetical protein